MRELQWLRRGEGLTLRKLASTPTLLWLGSGRGASGEPDGDAIFATDRMLRRQLADLGDGLAPKALRAALAVDRDDPRTLTHRRHDFAEDHNKHPDTVESHENRAIDELALRILRRETPRPGSDVAGLQVAKGDRGEGPGAGPVGSPPAAGLSAGGFASEGSGGAPGDIRLVRGHRALLDSLLAVVLDAQECLVTTGSRSRDPDYLRAIEDRVASSAVVHYRVLCGPPHWAVLKSHLLRLQEVRSESPPGGNPRIMIGLLEDLRREPEHFICTNERRAILILPSLNGLEHYDTALDLEGREYGTAYVRLVQEMYAASQPVETAEDILALPVLRE